MSTEVHKEVVRQLLSAHGRFDRGRVSELLAPDLVWHRAGTPGPMGRDDYLRGLEMGHVAFPDMTLTIDDILAEGDRVAVRLTHQMRHTGPFLDIPPTGRTLTFESFWIYRVHGRVVEAWLIDEDFVAKLRAP